MRRRRHAASEDAPARLRFAVKSGLLDRRTHPRAAGMSSPGCVVCATLQWLPGTFKEVK